MDGPAFLEDVREGNATALQRLGSERALVAVTAASIDREAVLDSAVTAEARAAATLDAWAADEPVEPARQAFAEAAGREREHLERVRSLAENDGDLADTDVDFEEPTDPSADALHEHLRSIDATVERVGAGMVARPLVASRTLLQVVNFFVNEGESAAAELFRKLRAETDDAATDGSELCVALTDDGDELARARAAADRAIEVAYDEYAERLSEMGVDPKPVC